MQKPLIDIQIVMEAVKKVSYQAGYFQMKSKRYGIV